MTNLILRLFVPNWQNREDKAVRDRCGRVAGFVGILTNLLLFTGKLIVGFLCSSVSIMADAVNNLTDSASSVVTMIAFKMSGRPADERHPFGHARIEYLSGVIVSFIVLFLGMELGITSVKKILHPEENLLTPAALFVLSISILVKLWQCLFYRKVGRLIHSDTLEATAKDSRNDMLSTAAVLVGAAISLFFNVNLDGWMGAVVALFILVSGVQLIMDTADPLIGQAPDVELVENIREKILSYEGVIGMHDLTVHNYGVGCCFASVHCEVNAERDILESHDLIDNIERDFKKDLDISLVIHLDPVITNDDRTNAVREQVVKIVSALYPMTSIHDFRVVWGKTHSNVVFDMAVPFSVKDADDVIFDRVEEAICSMYESFRIVITIDRC